MYLFAPTLPLTPTRTRVHLSSSSRRSFARPLRPVLPRNARQPLTPSVLMTLTPSTHALSTALHLADITTVNKPSLFATSFVFFLTFWGAISFVKGSTKPRITQASFTIRSAPAELARKTASYLQQRSFSPTPDRDSRPGVMTFTGQVRASSSVASILVFVAASAIWSSTYILNFVLPEQFQSQWWALLTVFSVAVVPWYWKKASREEVVQVMIEEDDSIKTDDVVSTLYMKGHRDEIESLERTFEWKRNEPVYEDEEKDVEVSAA